MFQIRSFHRQRYLTLLFSFDSSFYPKFLTASDRESHEFQNKLTMNLYIILFRVNVSKLTYCTIQCMSARARVLYVTDRVSSRTVTFHSVEIVASS